MSRSEFSVAVFFPDDSYIYECRFVSAEEAVRTFTRMTSNVSANAGLTSRVIITDGGDCTNMEWRFGKGITFPPPNSQKEEPNDEAQS